KVKRILLPCATARLPSARVIKLTQPKHKRKKTTILPQFHLLRHGCYLLVKARREILVHIPTLLTAAAAATLISSSAAQATIRLAHDPGGLVAAYQQRFAHARATGERIVIDGSCLSACTLAIGMVPREQIFAPPRAVLGLHAAWQPTPFGKAVSFPP